MTEQIEHHKRHQAYDGLKGLSIFIIITYTFFEHIIPGGFLIINAFLFLLGFANFRYFYQKVVNNEPLSMMTYYKQSMRRLFFPMLWFILLSAAFLLLFARNFLVDLAAPALSSLLFFNNYYQIFSDASFFDFIIPQNPFAHLWFISLLGQLILLTPWIVKIVYTVHKNPKIASQLLLVITVISAVTMTFFFHRDGHSDHIYYRLSTRAFAYTLGGAVNFLIPFDQSKEFDHKNKNMWLNILAVVSVIMMLLMLLFTHRNQSFAFQFGMFLFTILCAILFIVIVNPHSYWNRLFSIKPLRWLGKRSLSYYLWFYPIILVFSRWRLLIAVPYGLIFILTFIVIGCAAEISYRLFEQETIVLPIGQDFNLQKMVHQFSVLLKSGKNLIQVKLVTVIYIVVALLGILGIVVSEVTANSSEELQQLIQANHTSIEESTPTEQRAINQIEGLDQNILLYANGLEVTFFGDATLLSAASQIQSIFPKAVIDGETGRQLYHSYFDFIELDNQGLLKDTVVIMLGANGSFTQSQIGDIMSILGPNRKVYFITSNASRPWTQDVNEAMQIASERYGNAYTIDWANYTEKRSKTSEWLYSDDMAYPTTLGAQELAKFIAQEMYRMR